MPKKPDIYKPHRAALKSLSELVRLTQAAIEHNHKRVDATGVAKLVFEQRHNLKLILKSLKGGKPQKFKE